MQSDKKGTIKPLRVYKFVDPVNMIAEIGPQPNDGESEDIITSRTVTQNLTKLEDTTNYLNNGEFNSITKL